VLAGHLSNFGYLLLGLFHSLVQVTACAIEDNPNGSFPPIAVIGEVPTMMLHMRIMRHA
jgi:hypothetical protein